MRFFYNKKVRIWGGVIVVVAAIAGFKVWGGKSKTTYESIIVGRGELVQEVSVTGKVKAAQSVDLQFENSGRIGALNYKAGDQVRAGTVIASLENQDLQAAVLGQEAGLDSANADLAKTIKNTASFNDPSVSTSLRTELENSQSNLEQVAKKADGDLASDYNGAFSTIVEAITEVSGSVAVLEDIRNNYLQGKYAWDDYIKQLRDQAIVQVQGVRTVFPAVDKPGTTIIPAMYGNVDSALKGILGACQTMRTAFAFLQDSIQSNPGLVSSSTDRTRVNTEATSISSELSSISSAIQAVVDQKVTNAKSIADAQAQLAKARSAFPTPEDVAQKQAAVKQAQASLLSARSQLRKSLIVAPFTGIISKIDGNNGETVNSSKVIVSMISVSGYQIESNITEIDISKVKVGDYVKFTLDAYGPDTVFRGNISGIDPGETVIAGVTTYKTTVDFLDTQNILRPDMTANLDIQTDKKENVIAIPQRAVITKNGGKLVKVEKNGIIREVQVETGLSGKDGLVEITSGINEGDKVITFVNQ